MFGVNCLDLQWKCKITGNVINEKENKTLKKSFELYFRHLLRPWGLMICYFLVLLISSYFLISTYLSLRQITDGEAETCMSELFRFRIEM